MPHHGYTAIISAPKPCDICRALEQEVPAVYDACIIDPLTQRQTWANVCDQHMAEGKGQLGTGRGQRLVVRTP